MNSTNRISPSARATFSSGEHADALVHPGGDRDGGDDHRQRNQGRFRRQRVRNIEQHAQTVVELHDADTEGGGDAEDGADHRRNIDAVADGPIRSVCQKSGTAPSGW